MEYIIGSRYFLEAISPKYAVITSSKFMYQNKKLISLLENIK